MYCPRCGAQSDQGAKYCAACGAPLGRAADEPQQKLSLSERWRRLVGTGRTAWLLSIGTALAVVIAIAAFIALPSGDSSHAPSRDAYTVAADRTCIAAKHRIAAAGRAALSPSGRNDPGRYAAAIIPIVEQWRLALASPTPPPDRRDLVLALDSALRETMAQAGTLARLSREGLQQKQILAQAAEVDAATSRVEEAIRALGLGRCATLGVGVGRLVAR